MVLTSSMLDLWEEVEEYETSLDNTHSWLIGGLCNWGCTKILNALLDLWEEVDEHESSLDNVWGWLMGILDNWG